ncbi:NAD(P)/FAD-dependent oxidoreductase [Ferrovibrio xuzhouensis]|uniref:NAD(P)/FAD-dependent oxidoreductase n=1 Tax=Ferrovibrio xuzhouensis TaxID=1576914 RepID=A0ABV7VKP6_9PROT
MKRHVVIIGAGAVGAISALEALRRGFRVTILEPGEPGGEQAASYGNAGWLSSHSVIPPALPGMWRRLPGYLADPLGPLSIRWSYLPQALPWLVHYLLSGWTAARVEHTARALRPLLIDAPALHRALAEEAGVGALIQHSGLLHVFPTRADFAAESLSWEIRRRVGIDWIELEGAALRDREPDLDPRYRFGIFVAEAGHCRNPGAYVAALVAHANAQGASLVSSQATGLRIEQGHLQAVLTAGGEIPCDRAVIAAGARAKPLAAAAGDAVPLDVERGYHVSIAGTNRGPRTPIMVSDRKLAVTMTERGLRGAGQVEIAGLARAPDWRRAEVLRRHLLGLFPDLPRDLPAERVKTWMGFRPSMPDGLPCIGRASATPDVIHAFGHGHIGLVSSARTGRVVAQLLADVEPEIPLAPFDPRRFGA